MMFAVASKKLIPLIRINSLISSSKYEMYSPFASKVSFLSKYRKQEGNITAYPKSRPEFTIGGRRDALIATPTRPVPLLPRTARETAMPEKNATQHPETMADHVVLLLISSAGQNSLIRPSSCILIACPHWKTAIMIPWQNPTNRHSNWANNSAINPFLTSFQSRISVPNVTPNTGPIIGDTSMLATTVTGELPDKPTAARTLATKTSII
mmetsp:Transcript_13085/g.16279  ORF Transcript_13085/g.16279 Transcript_13085/m.16279 type:complete len:210 (-) Transcript_13085:830-1459(-)